jgi:hypothetical protein
MLEVAPELEVFASSFVNVKANFVEPLVVGCLNAEELAARLLRFEGQLA